MLINFFFFLTYTEWKVSKYGVFSGPYYPAFGLNMKRYFVSLRIQSECAKIRTRKNSVFGHISQSVTEVWYNLNGSDVYLVPREAECHISIKIMSQVLNRSVFILYDYIPIYLYLLLYLSMCYFGFILCLINN